MKIELEITAASEQTMAGCTTIECLKIKEVMKLRLKVIGYSLVTRSVTGYDAMGNKLHAIVCAWVVCLCVCTEPRTHY